MLQYFNYRVIVMNRFAAVIMRVREPRSTALVFASGKMIVTGAKNENDCKEAAGKYVAIIRKIGFTQAGFYDFRIQNMTATLDVGFPIRLEGLVYAQAAHSTYEPELFPGLVYRMDDPKIVLLIFVSGKVVMTGAKTLQALSNAALKIFPHLLEFRKKSSSQTAVVLSTQQQQQLSESSHAAAR